MLRSLPAAILVLIALVAGCSPYYGDTSTRERRQLAQAAAAKAAGDPAGACALLAGTPADAHPSVQLQHARCLLDPKSGLRDLAAARTVLERVYAMRSNQRGRAALLLATLEQQAGGTPQAQLAWLDRARELGETGTERLRLAAWKQAPDTYRTELRAAYARDAASDPYSALELARLLAEDPAADPAARRASTAAAIRALTAGAEAGRASHARTLAWIYETGELVPADAGAARHWLELAAKGGDAKALTRLADRAQAAGDLAGAQDLLQAAVAAGGEQAALNLARGYLSGRFQPGDGAAAGELIVRTAEASDSPALRVAYGRALLTGTLVGRDPDRGIALLEELAAQGQPGAQAELGRRLLRGQDLPQDAARGAALLEEAAAAGDAGALFHLARAHLHGHGLPPDQELGIAWLRRAAAAGSKGAGVELARRQLLGLGVPVEVARGRATLERLASSGHGEAMLQLGLAYAHGHGLRRDPGRAREWLGRAAATGNAPALEALRAIGGAAPGEARA